MESAQCAMKRGAKKPFCSWLGVLRAGLLARQFFGFFLRFAGFSGAALLHAALGEHADFVRGEKAVAIGIGGVEFRAQGLSKLLWRMIAFEDREAQGRRYVRQ